VSSDARKQKHSAHTASCGSRQLCEAETTRPARHSRRGSEGLCARTYAKEAQRRDQASEARADDDNVHVAILLSRGDERRRLANGAHEDWRRGGKGSIASGSLGSTGLGSGSRSLGSGSGASGGSLGSSSGSLGSGSRSLGGRSLVVMMMCTFG